MKKINVNLLVWNCRGSKAKDFIGLINDMIKTYYFSFCALVETHAGSERAKKIAKHCNFDGLVVIEAQGYASEIWYFWKSLDWNVQVLRSTSLPICPYESQMEERKSLKKKNRIDSLQDENGSWISDQQEVEQMATEFFAKLYTNDSQDVSFCL
ncbi:hypothetical protein RJT34_27111 [Clitoria ternatea]|uniref:Uncharacterized protein n=1 Tax=Clitoria ternatea TaxID=43366 RepID=A0AAN9F7F0_CLITE